jgi:hypothetical protein
VAAINAMVMRLILVRHRSRKLLNQKACCIVEGRFRPGIDSQRRMGQPPAIAASRNFTRNYSAS